LCSRVFSVLVPQNFDLAPANSAYNNAMRRSAITAICVMVLAAMPVLAQRGGGHASGGHGGFSGHASGGHFSGLRSSSGIMSHGVAGSRRSFSGRSFAHTPSFARRGTSINRRGPQIRSFNSRNCFGCRRFGYPWGYAGFYDPNWWWDSGSSYDQDYERNRALADQMNQDNLQEQQMRQQGDQDIYSHVPTRQSDSAQAAPAEVIPPTVLVFHDQRKQEVQNYAIVGQTLWNFSGQRTQKIPLSDLDLIATAEANEARGVEFRLPNTSEGQ